MFTIILMCFFACYAQAAACDDWCGADMKVIYHARISGSWEVSIKGKALFIESAEGPQNVYDVATEQVLKGFRFLPNITEQERCNPALQKPGVRELVCQKKPFLSEELMQCLEKIEEILPEKKGDAVAEHILCQKRKKYIARKTLRPEGKTRKWSVIPSEDATNVSFVDRVYLVFYDKSDALLGELCSEDTKISSAKTLLYFHKLPIVYTLQMTPADSVPTPEELLSLDCGSQYNLGIICFPRKGERYAALMNASLFTLSRLYTWNKKHHRDSKAAIEILKGELLAGYFIHSSKKIKKDIDVLRRPQVRSCICDQCLFTSTYLDVFVKYVGQFLKDDKITFQEKHDLWCGLQEEHCQNLCPLPKKFKWNIIAPHSWQHKLDKDTAHPGTVFILLQGETVALAGRPVDCGSRIDCGETSLFDYLCKRIVKPEAEQEEGWDDVVAL